MHQDKLEAVKQWSNDPCGANAAGAAVPGSLEFFERVEADRYLLYAPWMKQVFPFDRCRGLRVLEVGCGLGTDLMQFARGGAQCFGIDLTPRHLQLSRRRFELYAGAKARFARTDCESLPFRDSSFDVVYSFGVIHHTPGTQAAVDEIHRVLKPGGSAWIGLYYRESAYFWLSLVLRHGVLAGHLWRLGWRGLLAQIENRQHSDAQPLVKVYSKAQVRRLCGAFRQMHLSVHHLKPDHFSALRRVLTGRIIDRLEPYLGWYVVIRATK